MTSLSYICKNASALIIPQTRLAITRHTRRLISFRFFASLMHAYAAIPCSSLALANSRLGLDICPDAD
ncbi:hypothetical protein BJX70DRAFT_381707 [Aspergillus crustosus]